MVGRGRRQAAWQRIAAQYFSAGRVPGKRPGAVGGLASANLFVSTADRL